MTLKELRMWHWKQMWMLRAAANRSEAAAVGKSDLHSSTQVQWQHADRLNNQADFHLKAVQALNEVVPGTAEQDCNEADANKNA